MSEDKKKEAEKTNIASKTAAQTVATDVFGQANKKEPRSFGTKTNTRRSPRRNERPREEFEQRILDIARVTRVMAGGKRMSFRACVVIGDKKGNVAVALGKGADVTIAINKAVNKAKKNMIKVPMVKGTIPHTIFCKLGAARIMLKPAGSGKGIISGGVVRPILELAGLKNVTSKTIGTNNKINNARCTILALESLRKVEVKEDKNKKTVDNKAEIKDESEKKVETKKENLKK